MEKIKQKFLIILLISVLFFPIIMNPGKGNYNLNNPIFYPRGELNPFENLGDNAYGSREWDIVPGSIELTEGEYYKCLLSDDDGCNVNHPWNENTPDYYYLDFFSSNIDSNSSKIINIVLNMKKYSRRVSEQFSTVKTRN